MIEIIILVIILIIVLITVISIFIMYNGLIRLQNNIDKSWANIDVLLKQRSNEIPNLINTVKGYMSHEKEILESLTKARTSILSEKSITRKAAVDNLISNLLKSIFVVAEKYPDLKAGQNFLKLQSRITGLENELADRREFYNDSVTIYNIRIQSFPDMLVARLMHLNKVDLFKANKEDKKYVKVNF